MNESIEQGWQPVYGIVEGEKPIGGFVNSYQSEKGDFYSLSVSYGDGAVTIYLPDDIRLCRRTPPRPAPRPDWSQVPAHEGAGADDA